MEKSRLWSAAGKYSGLSGKRFAARRASGHRTMARRNTQHADRHDRPQSDVLEDGRQGRVLNLVDEARRHCCVPREVGADDGLGTSMGSAIGARSLIDRANPSRNLRSNPSDLDVRTTTGCARAPPKPNTTRRSEWRRPTGTWLPPTVQSLARVGGADPEWKMSSTVT